MGEKLLACLLACFLSIYTEYGPPYIDMIFSRHKTVHSIIYAPVIYRIMYAPFPLTLFPLSPFLQALFLLAPYNSLHGVATTPDIFLTLITM